MISAVIVSCNEAPALKRCLQSIQRWADEIVVIDLESHDHTKAVAAQFQAKIVSHPFVPYVELVRNFAIEQCQGDWILILDPDEQLPTSLKTFMRNFTLLHESGVLNIPRMNIFFGSWIRHTNFWPDYQIRFFRKGSVQWQELIHSYPQSLEPAIKLPRQTRFALRHTSYPTVSSFFSRQKRYAAVRAQERFLAGEQFSWWSLVYFPMREFLSRYVKHRGYLDRERGHILVIGLLYYFVLVELRLRMLQRSRNT